MNKREIEYTDQSVLNNAFYVSIALFFGIQTSVIWLVADDTWLAIGVLAGFILPIVYFFWKKRKAKQHGCILIGADELVFNVFGKERNIHISDIRQYQIAHYNGVSISLQLKDGGKLHLIANKNFCNAHQLEQACAEIQDLIKQYSTNNPMEEVPVRGKTMFEQTWFIVGLSIFSAALLGGMAYAIAIGKPFYPLLIPASIFIGFWVAVYNARRLRKSENTNPPTN